MEKQVSTLYPITDCEDKRKTLDMAKVMKGALCSSKTRSGPVIFRSNEFQKKNLEKKVKQYKSETKTEINSYESRKRNITQRFTMIFGRHKATNDSIHSYADVITKTLERIPSQKEDSLAESNVNNSAEEDKKLNADDADGTGTPDKDNVGDLKQNSSSQSQATNKDTLDKSITERKSVFIPSGILLPIKTKYSSLKFHKEVVEPEPEVEEFEEPKESWPLENKTPYDRYIRKQIDRQEALVTRNILRKIMQNISGKDTLLKFQMKAVLSDDPEEFVNYLTSIKTDASDKSSNKNTHKQFQKYISSLTSRATKSKSSLQPYRKQEPVSSNTVKSTVSSNTVKSASVLTLKRSHTMPL